MTFHARVQTDDGIHTPFAWVFTDASARSAFTPLVGLPATAAGLLAVDVGRVALQADDGSLWRLTDHDAPTWAQVGRVYPAMTGDSGSGGAVGLVPAPSAGHGAAGRVLLADGTWGWPVEPLICAASGDTEVLTTGAAKLTFRVPYACELVAIRASLTTASSSGPVTIDANENGTTLLSTKLTIDEGSRTSGGAAVPPVISDPALADDAEVTIDVDAAGTNAAGLKVTLYVRRTA